MRNTFLSTAVGLAVLLSAACSGGGSHTSSRRQDSDAHAGSHGAEHSHAAAGQRQPELRQAEPRQNDPHGFGAVPGLVPAYQTDAAALKSLPPTLDPEKFTGRRREGYAAVRAIPETIAQLPCYCHCDRGFGHKSLHSCFVDDHGANCSICLEEALLAYRLEKEEKLNPEQIRERIVAQYGGR